MKTQITIALIVLAILTGWIAGGGRNIASAQGAADVPAAQAPSQCYEIPVDVKLDRQEVLLNKCTGETWRFDSGWSYSEDRYVRPHAWKTIEKD